MKTNKFFLAIAFGALSTTLGAGAFANDKWLGERGDNWLEHIQSTKTRAEVMAELEEARAQGLLTIRDSEYPVLPAATSTRSRAEVQIEASEAARNQVRNPDYRGG